MRFKNNDTTINVSADIYSSLNYGFDLAYICDKDEEYCVDIMEFLNHTDDNFIIDWKEVNRILNGGSYPLNRFAYIDPRKETIFKHVNWANNSYLRETCTSSIKLKPKKTYYFNENSCELELSEDDDDNGGSGDCFIGRWKQNLNDCDDSDAYKTFKFNSNGSGTSSNVIVQGYNAGCSVLCRVTFEFDWTQTSSGSIVISYNNVYEDGGCGVTPQLPSSDDNITVSCSGSSLTLNGQTYNSY